MGNTLPLLNFSCWFWFDKSIIFFKNQGKSTNESDENPTEETKTENDKEKDNSENQETSEKQEDEQNTADNQEKRYYKNMKVKSSNFCFEKSSTIVYFVQKYYFYL